jgi:hypothetical protein
VIVVDGASDDQTPAVLRDANDSWATRCGYIARTAARGSSAPANKGFRAVATGAT